MATLKKAQARDMTLPTVEQKRAAALLQSWIDAEDETEQRETGEALLAGLDKNRPSERQLFPPELAGESW